MRQKYDKMEVTKIGELYMLERIKTECDLWQNLKSCKKPILLYGMGDGADKVLDVCNEKGIKISGVFASDGFAKNKVFRGFSVTDYSTAKENFGEMTVLVSFASSLENVIENVVRISKENELYIPDVPVFGTGLFDKEYVMKNADKFETVYSLLSDDISKDNYTNLILGKMTGRFDYLRAAETTVEEAYNNIICPKENSHYVDIGAYNGDTIREFLSYSNGCNRITAFEPDVRNFRKLCSYADENCIDKSDFYNIAAWNKKETLTFYSRSGRNSANTTSHKNTKSIEIQADAVDNYINSKVDFINIDAEGSDRNVLLGLEKTIHSYHPVISCAVYHRNEDFFDIPLLLKEMYGECKMYIRHFRYFPAWDTNIYVTPAQN